MTLQALNDLSICINMKPFSFIMARIRRRVKNKRSQRAKNSLINTHTLEFIGHRVCGGRDQFLVHRPNTSSKWIKMGQYPALDALIPHYCETRNIVPSQGPIAIYGQKFEGDVERFLVQYEGIPADKAWWVKESFDSRLAVLIDKFRQSHGQFYDSKGLNEPIWVMKHSNTDTETKYRVMFENGKEILVTKDSHWKLEWLIRSYHQSTRALEAEKKKSAELNQLLRERPDLKPKYSELKSKYTNFKGLGPGQAMCVALQKLKDQSMIPSANNQIHGTDANSNKLLLKTSFQPRQVVPLVAPTNTTYSNYVIPTTRGTSYLQPTPNILWGYPYAQTPTVNFWPYPNTNPGSLYVPTPALNLGLSHGASSVSQKPTLSYPPDPPKELNPKIEPNP